MAVVDYTVDNLITGTKSLNTLNKLQLEDGQSVVRGEVLKAGTTGLVALDTLATDEPLCVALQTVATSGAAEDIAYTNDCSLDVRELTFGDGDLDDYRVKLMLNTNILLEGDE